MQVAVTPCGDRRHKKPSVLTLLPDGGHVGGAAVGFLAVEHLVVGLYDKLELHDGAQQRQCVDYGAPFVEARVEHLDAAMGVPGTQLVAVAHKEQLLIVA